MNVSKSFLRDFAYLANRYGWTAADIEEIKVETRAKGAPMVAYWTMLAAAHRAGYEQTAENNYPRLHKWQAMQAGSQRSNFKSDPSFFGGEVRTELRTTTGLSSTRGSAREEEPPLPMPLPMPDREAA